MNELPKKKNGFGMSLVFIITFCIGYGLLQGQVRSNANNIEDVKDCPVQVAALEISIDNIEDDVKEIEDDVKEIKIEQRTLRKEMNEGFLKILREIRNND